MALDAANEILINGENVDSPPVFGQPPSNPSVTEGNVVAGVLTLLSTPSTAVVPEVSGDYAVTNDILTSNQNNESFGITLSISAGNFVGNAKQHHHYYGWHDGRRCRSAVTVISERH